MHSVCQSDSRKLLQGQSIYEPCHEIMVLFVHHKLIPQPEDHWSCIAHLSAEDTLKSEVTEEKKFKHSPRVGADNPLRPKFEFNRKASSLWSFVASLKRISSTSDIIYIFS